MFRSIRWRLVTSYTFIALLTASLVGVLALSLLRRSITQQEKDYLTANAESLAREALPLIEPVVNTAGLNDLVSAAAFLDSVQVSILDAEHQVLASSSQTSEASAFLWSAIPPFGQGSRSTDGAGLPGVLYVVVPYLTAVQADLAAQGTSRRLPDGAVVVVRRAETVWGGRFVIDDRPGAVTTEGQAEAIEAAPLEGEQDAASVLTATIPIGDSGQPSGYVEITKSIDMSLEALTTARNALLLASAGALSMAAMAGLWVSQRLTAPIRSLTGVANRMAAGDLTARANAGGNDETGHLSRQFNQMAEQVQTSFATLQSERDTLRRFVADASHELRTPVTALRTFNELLQDGALDEATRAEFLTESAEQIQRLSWITSHLLDLTRLDAGLAALELAPYMAGALLEQAVAPFRLPAKKRGLSLVLVAPSPELAVTCDGARVVLALSNLLDNALKFTPSGGTVTLGAEPTDEGVCFWVRDTGRGIAADEQAHVFERFYRGAHVDQEVPGCGLGLAIVRAVAESHGGHTAVESTEGSGCRFTIELPRR